MDYKQYKHQTKEAYKTSKKASTYKKAYSEKISLKNFKTKIIATREREIVRSFLSYLQQQQNLPESICDVPSGTGKMTDILLSFRIKVTNGDISKSMLSHIDPELKKDPNYKEEKILDACNLPFEKNSFDMLLNIRLLHRVNDDTRRKILKEAHRVTKKYYIVSFALNNQWHNFRLQIRKILSRDSSPGRVKKKKIKNELKNIGFKIIKEKRVLPILSNESILLLKKTSSF